MIDSVFSPLLADPFPDDRPLIPVDEIETALDAIEADSAEAQQRILTQEIQSFLDRAVPLLREGDVDGIQRLNWSAPIRLQYPILDVWRRGYLLGGEQMLAEMQAGVPQEYRFALIPRLIEAVKRLLGLKPQELPQDGPVVEAIRQRSLQLAGRFSNDQLARLKQDLIDAVSDNPISRTELEKRIIDNLQVAKLRAEMIARTELTAAYNRGRIATAQQSELVTHMRYLAIMDNRTTPICRSRNGLLYPIGSAELAMNTPALHVRCRSVLSPVMGEINSLHAEWLADPSRNPENRTVAALPDGWNTFSDDPEIEEFARRRGGKKGGGKNCKKQRCGQSCIALNKVCWVGLTGEARKKVIALRAKSRSKSGGGSADDIPAYGNFSDNPQEIIKAGEAFFKPYEDRMRVTKLEEAMLRRLERAYEKAYEKDRVEGGRDNWLALQDAEKKYFDKRDELAARRKKPLMDLRQDLMDRMSYEQAEKLLEKYVTISTAVNPKADDALNAVMVDYVRLTNGKGLQTLKQIDYTTERAYASEKSGVINIGGRNDGRISAVDKQTLLHEFGHHVEFSDKSGNVGKAAFQMVLDRSTGPTARLKDTGGKYDDDEYYVPDKWLSPYTGKVYPEKSPGIRDTEVISMGLQHFTDSTSMQMLYKGDREHFMFILGILQ